MALDSGIVSERRSVASTTAAPLIGQFYRQRSSAENSAAVPGAQLNDDWITVEGPRLVGRRARKNPCRVTGVGVRVGGSPRGYSSVKLILPSSSTEA